MGNVRVRLPPSLRQFWGGAREVRVEAATLADALRALGARHPGLAERVLDDAGRIRRHVHVFVNLDAVDRAPADVALADGDVVHVLPAVSGGLA